jgi:hypothetical protein
VPRRMDRFCNLIMVGIVAETCIDFRGLTLSIIISSEQGVRDNKECSILFSITFPPKSRNPLF